LFYLAVDSVSDVASPVVRAESFVTPTGAEKHGEERKKTGILKDRRLLLLRQDEVTDFLDQLQRICNRRLTKSYANNFYLKGTAGLPIAKSR
jgi:hypothetical protein